MRRLPNLLKLSCTYLESRDALTNCNKFPVLDFLIRLESLKIFYFGKLLNPGELNLPWSLKKLTLSNFRLPWTHIGAIGRLKNLEVLKLLCKAFEGPTWDMREGEFVKLKYLELDSLNISQWNANRDDLPALERLVLRNCMNLDEVPIAFEDMTTLEMIEVHSSASSTEKSVQNIAEANENIKIIINQSIPFETIN